MHVERKLWACVLASLTMLMSACGGNSGSFVGSAGGGGTGSGGTQVAAATLTLGSDSVSAGTPSVNARAAVTDTGGAPVKNQQVTFTTTRGTLSSTTATTDANGIATVFLTPPTSAGPVRVQALVSGFVQEQTLTVVPGAADPAHSSLTASPSTLVADGVSTTTATVFLNDLYGNPLPDATSVTLLASAGTIVGGNTKSLASGGTSFTLKAPSAPSSATISVQGVGLSTTVSFATSNTGDPASIRFAVPSARIAVTGVGQADTASITITVLDASGNVIREAGYPTPRSNNLRVKFVTSPNGGESISGNSIGGTLQTAGYGGFIDIATQGGVAVVNLRAGTLPGIVELSVSALSFAGTSLGNAADVSTTAVAPPVSIASGPATTIAFSAPITGAIENLGNGNYRRRGKVDVTDRYGNSVPDGTVVNFTLLDTAILHDNTGAAGANAQTLSRSGSSLITRTCSTQPTVSSEASGCTAKGNLAVLPATPPVGGTADFANSQKVFRNGVLRPLGQGDRILIRNAIDADKIQTISAINSATQAAVFNQFSNNLSNGEFWAGASLSGAQIFGADPSGTLTVGTGVTTNGVAELRVTYPANIDTILTGCYGYPYQAANGSAAYSDRDRRDSVPQSRQVVVAASSGTTATAVTQGTFCFSAIAGTTLTPTPKAVTLSPATPLPPASPTTPTTTIVSIQVRDGGDTIPLPYVGMSCAVTAVNSKNGFSVSAAVLPNSDGDAATNVSGFASVLITRTDNLSTAGSGDSATITCNALDGTTTITATPG